MKHSSLISVFFLIFFLSGCASTIPAIYLQSADIEMDLHRPAYGISDMSISRDGSLLLAGDIGPVSPMRKQSYDAPGSGNIRLWDLVRGNLVRSITIRDIQVLYTVALSPDGRYALAGGQPTGGKSGLTMWDLTTGEQVWRFPELRGDVFSASFSRDGRRVLATTVSVVFVFDFETGRTIARFDTGYRQSLFSSGALPYVTAQFSPDGKYVLSGGHDAVLHLWEAEGSAAVRSFTGHKRGIGGGISGISISPDGKHALTCAIYDSSARLWDLQSGKEIQNFSGLSVALLGAWGTAMSPDGKYGFVIALPLGIWDLASGKQVTPLQLQSDRNAFIPMAKPGSAVYNPNGKTVLMTANDAAVRIFDSATGREIAMLVAFDDGEWIVITSEGYYNASEKGAQYLTANLGQKEYSVESFYDVFYRPDIVRAALEGEDTRGLVTITMNDAVKNPPPTVDFTQSFSESTREKLKICYQVRSAGGGIGEVRLFHNGKLIQSDGYYREMAGSAAGKRQELAMGSKGIYEDMRSVSVMQKSVGSPASAKAKGEVFSDCREVEPVFGENEISIAAFNSNNTVQSYMKTMKFVSRVQPADPHLYILSIGLDRYKDSRVNLKYAVKDARDFEEKLRAQAASVYKPQNIHFVLVTDAEATKANFTRKIDELAGIIKPRDSFVMFAAGHGVLLQNQYYLLTHDYDGAITDAAVISSNEIVETSKRIKSLGQLLIFDTCHAGRVDSIVSGLYDARMSVLARKMGLHIYASASDKQSAMDGYKGNGLFTYTLLEGLNNNREADRNKDGTVTVVGLGEYSKKKTALISKEVGHSQTPLIINFGKDSPIYRLP